MVYGENDERFQRTVRGGESPSRRARTDGPALGRAAVPERPRGAHVRPRGGSREVIDARGSIDSRTFNETHEISSTTKDARDRHSAELDSISHTSWRSRAGQGFDSVPDAGAGRRIASRPVPQRSKSNIGFSGGVMSSGPNYGRSSFPSKAVVVLVAIAIVLVAVVAFLLLR